MFIVCNQDHFSIIHNPPSEVLKPHHYRGGNATLYQIIKIPSVFFLQVMALPLSHASNILLLLIKTANINIAQYIHTGLDKEITKLFLNTSKHNESGNIISPIFVILTAKKYRKFLAVT